MIATLAAHMVSPQRNSKNTSKYNGITMIQIILHVFNLLNIKFCFIQ